MEDDGGRYCSVAPPPASSGADDLQRAMIVAVVAMRVVQAAIDEVIDMVAMRHGFMPAAGAVNVARFVSAAVLTRRAAVRVRLANLDDVLVHMVAMRVMQVAVM